jgi:hypothetical protein
MDDSWSDCSYCQRTGFQRSGLADGLDKTRIESSLSKGSSATPPASDEMRRTVLLSAVRPGALVGWLVAMNGKHKGEDFRVREGQNIIGSNSSLEITLLSDSTISAKHASIRYRDGVFSLTDLDSTNGTFLNGAELVPSDEVYDRYRAVFLYEAASLAVGAASTEAGTRGYSAGPTPSSGSAVQFARTYL